MHASVSAQPAVQPEVKALVSQQVRKGFLFIVIEAGILFVASGRLYWPGAWIYLGYCAVIMASLSWLLGRYAPELVKERVKPYDAKNWDFPLATFQAVQGPLLLCLVAGLDARFHWSHPPAIAVRVAALCAALLGDGIRTWAMLSNPFFSSVIRLQKERGQSVMSRGPYRLVRHPGYLGMSLFQLAFPFMLGTLWALAVVALMLAVTLLRTLLEDAMLRRELPGYADYAARVRFRLIPRLW